MKSEYEQHHAILSSSDFLHMRMNLVNPRNAKYRIQEISSGFVKMAIVDSHLITKLGLLDSSRSQGNTGTCRPKLHQQTRGKDLNRFQCKPNKVQNCSKSLGSAKSFLGASRYQGNAGIRAKWPISPSKGTPQH